MDDLRKRLMKLTVVKNRSKMIPLQTCEIDKQLPGDPIEVVFGQVPPSLAVADQQIPPRRF